MLNSLFATDIYWHTATKFDSHRVTANTPKDLHVSNSDVDHPHRVSTSMQSHKCILTHLDLAALSDYIHTHVDAFYPSSEPSIKLTRSWFNVCNTGDGQIWHSHARATISGTLYITVPDGSIEFRSPNPYTRHQEWPYAPTAIRTPSPGDVVLWPSWLEHRVHANTSPSERISLSFDFA